VSSDEAPQPYDFAATPSVPQMPWEERGRPFAARLWATLGSTFHPVRDVARVTHGPVAPAARFALLTAIPVMLLSGILPCTRLLQFDSNLSLTLKGSPTPVEIALDVGAGAGLGMLILVTGWAFSCWNFVALSRFAADPALAPVTPVPAAWRVGRYRAWLLPAAVLLLYLTLWVGPTPNATRGQLLNLAFVVFPGVVQMLHFSATARYFGASSLASVPVSFAPVLIYWLSLGMGYQSLMELGYLPAADASGP